MIFISEHICLVTSPYEAAMVLIYLLDRVLARAMQADSYNYGEIHLSVRVKRRYRGFVQLGYFSCMNGLFLY
jgi:hypothetical protein